MTDELHTPLGQKQPEAAGGIAIRLALSGGLVVAGLAGGAWLGSVYFTPPPELPAIAVAPTGTTTASPTAAEPPGAAKAESAPPESETAETGSTGAGETGMRELAPTGELQPLAPVPVPAPRRQELALAHLPDPALGERTEAGLLPIRGPEGQRPMDVYSRPPATEGNFGVARIVIVVGGIGISQTSSQMAVQKLPPSVTLAFAPSGNSLARWMQQARKRGFELLVQLPMEPFDYPRNDPGPDTITVGASDADKVAALRRSLGRLTNYVGAMNFLGGRLMADATAVGPVFDELAGRGLLFLDDGSARNTATATAAGAARLPHARAHIQLDTGRTRQEISARLDELAAQAKRTGLAIGVANAFPESIELIAKFAEGAAAKGIEITPVSAIVDDPEKGGR